MLDKSMRDWLKNAYSKGFDRPGITRHLLNNGYSPAQIVEVYKPENFKGLLNSWRINAHEIWNRRIFLKLWMIEVFLFALGLYLIYILYISPIDSLAQVLFISSITSLALAFIPLVFVLLHVTYKITDEGLIVEHSHNQSDRFVVRWEDIKSYSFDEKTKCVNIDVHTIGKIHMPSRIYSLREEFWKLKLIFDSLVF